MKITTMDYIDGYEIVEYLGLVSGTKIYTVGGLIGEGLASQEGLFSLALEGATINLRKKAEALEADAVLGVQQSFANASVSGSMILALIGTAVKLRESEESKLRQKRRAAEVQEMKRVAEEKRREEEREAQAEFDRKEDENRKVLMQINSQVNYDELSTIQKAIIKEIHITGELKPLTFAKALPRSLPSDALQNALKQLEELGIIHKNENSNYIFVNTGVE